MTKNFFDKNFFKRNDRIAIINEKSEKFSYSKIFNIGKKLNIEKGKKFIFVLVKNSHEPIIAYIYFLSIRSTVFLINNDLSKDIYDKLLDLYRPNYIFCPQDKKEIFLKYKAVIKIDNYLFLKTNFQVDYKINNKLALLLSTSGSTGNPQVVKLTYDNLSHNAKSICRSLKIRKDDVAITSLPLSYTYGLSIINSHFLAKGKVVVTDKSVITREFWKLIKKFKVTNLGGVPFTYEMLKKIGFEKMNLPSIRYITQAGGKLSEELVKEFKKICFKKKIKFFIMYGQTEATSRISILDWKNLEGNENSIGKAIFQGKLYIVNDKFKKITSINVPGELVYEGQNVCLGYAKDRFDLAKEDQNKGILYTGDIAYKNKKNFFFIVGRKKRFVKIFSHRINLDDIENVIKKYGFDCACTQSKDKILLFLKNDDSNSKSFIEKIIKNKMPFLRNFYKLKYIGTIPRSESGKILYSKLSKNN